MVIDQPHTITQHPQWAHHNVVLICGPPGSGKSTLAAQLAPNVIAVENYTHSTVRANLRAFGRDAYQLGRNPYAHAAVIRGAPTITEREHQQQLCHPRMTIILLVPADECHRRVTERSREQLDYQHNGIDEWWRTYQPCPHADMRTTRAW